MKSAENSSTSLSLFPQNDAKNVLENGKKIVNDLIGKTLIDFPQKFSVFFIFQCSHCLQTIFLRKDDKMKLTILSVFVKELKMKLEKISNLRFFIEFSERIRSWEKLILPKNLFLSLSNSLFLSHTLSLSKGLSWILIFLFRILFLTT